MNGQQGGGAISVTRELVVRVLREHGVPVTEQGDSVTILSHDGEPEVYYWPTDISPRTITRLARKYGHNFRFTESDFYEAARAAVQ